MQQADVALKQSNAALKEAQSAMANVREVIDPESPIDRRVAVGLATLILGSEP